MCSCERKTTFEYEAISLEELRGTTEFNARVEVIDVTETPTSGVLVTVVFTKADGSRIGIGEFPADDLLVEFAGSLEEGKTYKFPDTFLEFESSREGRTVTE